MTKNLPKLLTDRDYLLADARRNSSHRSSVLRRVAKRRITRARRRLDRALSEEG